MNKIIRTKTEVKGGITEAEQIKLKEHTENWIKIAFRTEPIDKEKITEAIKGLYKVSNLEEPIVVICPSPIVMTFAGTIASLWWATHSATASATASATDSATYSATYSATDSATASATDSATRSATDSATDSATHSATASATDLATYLATASATASAIYSATASATASATDSATYLATDSATRSATASAIYSATVSATDSATDLAIDLATDSAIASATRSATDSATHSATASATVSAIYSAIDLATDSAIASATRLAIDSATASAIYSAIDLATYSATDSATDSAIDLATRSATDLHDWLFPLAQKVIPSINKQIFFKKLNNWNFVYQGGNMWAAYLCYLSAFRYILGLDLPIYEKYKYWEEAAKEGGFRYMHEKFCIVSDFPEFIRVNKNNQPHCDGAPSHRWRDGWSLWHLNGVKVEQWMAETPPEKLNAKEILKIENVDQRRETLKRLGVENLVKQLGGKIIDTDYDSKFGKISRYELLQLDLGLESGVAHFLKMNNPSIDAIHVEGVPRECFTVQEAINWRRYGTKTKQWQPEDLT